MSARTSGTDEIEEITSLSIYAYLELQFSIHYRKL